MRSLFAFFLGFSCSVCHGSEICESSKGIATSSSRLMVTSCSESGVTTREFLSLNGLKLVEDKFLSREDRDAERRLWVYSGDVTKETGCSGQIYLLDLEAQPKVFVFGVKGACTEFHWASWGKKRSVIALKNNVKFTYENGKLNAPVKDVMFISAIEPPHAGLLLDESKLLPFARELPLPK